MPDFRVVLNDENGKWVDEKAEEFSELIGEEGSMGRKVTLNFLVGLLRKHDEELKANGGDGITLASLGIKHSPPSPPRQATPPPAFPLPAPPPPRPTTEPPTKGGLDPDDFF